MSVRLFISHSSKDLWLVKPLTEFLRSSLNLSAREIRCTNVDGHRLSGGAETAESLRNEVCGTDAFIGLISTASMESLYVVFELGARWGANKHLIPVLAHGTAAEILKSPLSNLNALRADSREQLHQLVNDLAHQLGLTPERPESYERHLTIVLEARPSHEVNTVVQASQNLVATTPQSENKSDWRHHRILYVLSRTANTKLKIEEIVQQTQLPEIRVEQILSEFIRTRICNSELSRERDGILYFLTPPGKLYVVTNNYDEAPANLLSY